MYFTKRITITAVLDENGVPKQETAKFEAFDDMEPSSEVGFVCEDTTKRIVAIFKAIIPPEQLTRIKAEL